MPLIGVTASQRVPEVAAGGKRHWRLYMPTNGGAFQYSRVGELALRAVDGGASLTGSGTPSASSSENPASLAFDGNITEHWRTAGGQNSPCWLAYDFGVGEAKTVGHITLTATDAGALASSHPTTGLVQSSDDGSAWATEWVMPPQTGWTDGEARGISQPAGLPDIFLADAPRQDTSPGTSLTFAAVNFGPERTDRLVAVAVLAESGNSSMTASFASVTIGGEAAVRAVQSRSTAGGHVSRVEVWTARPSGTSGDVVVTFGYSATTYARAFVWNIGGAATQAPDVTDSKDAGVSGDMSIAAPSNSVVIAASYSSSGVVLGGLESVYYANILAGIGMTAAEEMVATGATKTITSTKTGPRVAACWSIT